MRSHSGPFLSFLAYYMGAPSDQFLRIEYGGPLRSVSSLIMEASLCGFFSYYMGTPQIISLHTILGPQITFFAYYMGSLRSVSSQTIWGPLSDQFRCLLYGPPSDQFLCMLLGGNLRFWFLHKIYGAPLRSVSPLTIWGRPAQVSFFAYYMGPLRSVSSLTI